MQSKEQLSVARLICKERNYSLVRAVIVWRLLMSASSNKKKFIVFLVIVAALVALSSCTPPGDKVIDPFQIIDNEANQLNKDFTSKEQAIWQADSSITHLQEQLNERDADSNAYYLNIGFKIDTDTGASFILNIEGNFNSVPYEVDGIIDTAKLEEHNELIKKNDIVLEWYDGKTNDLLIGYYFDGINPNSADRGNHLYLNLQGEKRIFYDFGDTVAYQQFVRAITSFNIEELLVSGGILNEVGEEDTDESAIKTLLSHAVTSNYKKVRHEEDIDTILFYNVQLNLITDSLTNIIQDFFSPYEDKVDPLTNKYLGFDFSVLGNIEILTLNADIVFTTEMLDRKDNTKDEYSDGKYYLLRGVTIDLEGTSLSQDQNVPFISTLEFNYDERPRGEIKIDKEGYVGYDQGKYEFKAELHLPSFQDLIMDGIIRTDVNPDDNDRNRVFAEFRDRSNEELMLGLYYINEKTYIDTTGLEHAYGGVKLSDIGLPKAYMDNFDLAKILKTAFNFFDNFLISFVDDFVKPKEDSKSDRLMEAIMDKMESTKKANGQEKNSVNIKVDLQLVKDILYEEKGIDYSTEDIVSIINIYLGMDLDEIATVLGVTNSKKLLEQSWFYITFDVDTNEITIKFFSDYNDTGTADLMMQLILWPEKVGEEVYMVFPSKLDEYKPLGRIETYSAEINGKFTFQNDEEVDLSGLLGSFMGDPLGLNTSYTLPEKAALEINLLFDQYIREQTLEGGRQVQKSRNAFILRAFISDNQGNELDVFRVYANDVSFKSDATIEDLGYIWVDLVCLPDIPKFKIREDIVLNAFSVYMGESGVVKEGTSLGVTTILAAILEDSWPVFEPEVINITSSNETLRKIFGVNSLIGDLNAKVGLKQRVKGIDHLEKDFANYRVSNFADISGANPYEIKLHETLDVIFDYGNYQIVVPMKVAYDRDSIAIVENQVNYNVKIHDTFMGVTRGYTVRLTGGVGSRNKITDIKASSNNNFVWEPLEPIPISIVADYAGGQYTYYNVLYTFYDEANELNWSFNGTELVLQEKDSEATYIRLQKGGKYYFDSGIETLYFTFNGTRLKKEENKEYTVYTLLQANGLYSYMPQLEDFNLSQVGVEGGTFVTTLTIGKGMMATFSKDVTIKVTNRKIDTEETRRVITDPYSLDRTRASVADEITIDPYEYILAKYRYFATPANQGKTNQDFINSYFGQFNITINFMGDTPSYTGKFASWKFDQFAPDPSNPDHYDSRIWVEQDITPAGAQSFYWAFNGSELVLQTKDPFLTYNRLELGGKYIYNDGGQFSYFTFDGLELIPEEGLEGIDYTAIFANELYSYTTDGTYSTYMHTMFKGQVILLKVNVVARTFKELQFEGEAQPNVYTVDVLLGDTYTIPTRAKIIFEEVDAEGNNYYIDLINLDPIINFNLTWSNPAAIDVNINGTEHPFGPEKNNLTSARISLFDSDRTVGVGEWFPAPYAIVKVLCPPKIVPTVEPMIIDDVQGIRAIYSMEGDDAIYGDFASSMIRIGDNQNYGMYEVDPFNPSSWIIPKVVTIYFESGYTREYTVEWDTTKNIVQFHNGEYRFIHIGYLGDNECYYRLEAQIGNEDIGYQTIVLAIRKLTSNIVDAAFTGHEGINISGSLATGYDTEIDPFEEFKLPTKIIVNFADGASREYATAWQESLSYVPGTSFTITTKLGDSSNPYFAIEHLFELMVSIKKLTVTGITITNMPDNNIIIDIDYQNKIINISGIILNSDGLVETITFDGDTLFDNLYENIKYILQEFSLTFHEITDTYVITPNLYNYSTLFDTQETIKAQGQDLTIGLARYPDSIDFTVNVKATGGRPLKQLEEHEMLISIKPYELDGTFNYPNGLDLSAQAILITYADYSTAIFNLSEWRVITCPNPNYNIGDTITVISESDVKKGGIWRLCSRLPDGSNIIRIFDIAIIDVGPNYGTIEGYEGNLPIVGGKITIKDIYAFYPLQNNINIRTLPTTICITIYHNIVVDDIQWTLVSGLASALSQVNYQTGFTEQVIATTQILGQEIKLKLEVLPCVIKSVSVEDTVRGGTEIESSDTQPKLFFDPYHNSPYNGFFQFLELHYIVKFASGNTHKFTSLQFLINGFYASTIPYDITGHKMAISGEDVPNSKLVKLHATLPDGQALNIDVQFYNKTFVGIGLLESVGANNNIIDTYYIDPYDEDIVVPYNVYIKFQEGRDLHMEDIGWTLPQGFRIDYRGGNYTDADPTDSVNTNLTKQLAGYGVTVQKAYWDLVVYKRELSSYTLNQINNENNPYFHITDPYAGRVQDLPEKVVKDGYNPNDDDIGVPFSDLSIVWSLTDLDITYTGTTNLVDGYMLVVGYIKNAEVGQRVEIRLFIDRWEFNSLFDEYNLMNPANFVFSRIDNKSLPHNYTIRFKITNARTGVVSYNEIAFVAECYAESEDKHIIYWNENGKLQARNADVPIATDFSIGNPYKAKVGISTIAVYYQYQTPSVTRLDFGYQLGGKNEVILVLNPFAPAFPDTPIAIEGTSDQVNFVALDQIFTVSITWPEWDPVAESKYLKGGIRYGYPAVVTLKVVNEYNIVTYQTQTVFRVNLLFLDMTQIQISEVNASSIPTTMYATAKSTYVAGTYEGQVNPYGDIYTDYAPYEGLNYHIYDALTKGYQDLGIDTFSLYYYNITWQPVPDPIGPDTILRSVNFMLNNKQFYSNHLRIKVV